MPLFNKAPYVKKALESIISQSFTDFEIIVIDDGSKDGSSEIAEETLKHSPVRSRLIRQENTGASTARNTGVKESSGDFICFLDADDWWAPTFLERMDWLINAYPEACIYGTNYYYVKNGRERVCVTTAETGYINYCKVYGEKLEMPLTSISIALTRRVFDEFGGFKPTLRLGEDFDLWIRIALKHKVAFLNEPLAFYFQDSEKKWRAIGHLHSPQEHMLWNLEYLEREEKNNPNYKKLVDKLRVYSLLPYYLSKQYREDAKHELAKVDWELQPTTITRQYKTPIFLLKSKQFLLKVGSHIKQFIIKHL
jgi:glycosyltransferase involved in cell wall biosynthesis